MLRTQLNAATVVLTGWLPCKAENIASKTAKGSAAERPVHRDVTERSFTSPPQARGISWSISLFGWLDHPDEDVGQVRERIDVVQITGFDQGGDDGPMFGTAARSCE